MTWIIVCLFILITMGLCAWCGYDNDDWDDAWIIFLWPLPFLGAYRIGERLRLRKEKRIILLRRIRQLAFKLDLDEDEEDDEDA